MSTLKHLYYIKRNFVLKNIMKPILYYDDRSPPVRSCLMLIDYLNIDCDLKFIDLFQREQFHSDYVKLNAAHTVPTFQDDHVILTDSHTIMIYLYEKYGTKFQDDTKNLLPIDNICRIKILDKLFFESSLFFRRDSDLMSEIIRKGYKNIDLEQHEKKIIEVYGILNEYLQNSQYIASDSLSLADFSIVTTLSTVNVIFPLVSNNYPQLFKWFENMKLLPCYKKSNEKGLQSLRDALIKFGNLSN